MEKVQIKLFGASWCQACKMIKPLLERLGEVTYIDVDENVETTAAYGVRGLPTFVNESNGKRGTGSVQNTQQLREILDIPQ